MSRNYLWSNNPEEKKVNWLSWNHLCKTKEQGGMGFRRLVDFNSALLAKQLWRIFCQPQSLVSRLLKTRYFKHGDLQQASIGANPSFVWRSFMWNMELFKEGHFWHLNGGKEVHVFSHKWVPGLEAGRPKQRLATNTSVNNYFTTAREWDLRMLDQAFLPYELEAIKQVKIGKEEDPDIPYWRPEAKGVFTVRSAYNLSLNSSGKRELLASTSDDKSWKTWWMKLWKFCLPPKVRIFSWKLVHNIIPTAGNLNSRHVPIDPKCEF